MFNTVLVLVIIYLLISGGEKGFYNRIRGDGYGRRNSKLSRGRYSEYGGYGGQNQGRFDKYNRYENDYGPQNNNSFNNSFNNDFSGSFGNRDGQLNNNNRNSFDDW